MKKSVLIQIDQKEFESIIFKCVCQAIKLNAPASTRATVNDLSQNQKTVNTVFKKREVANVNK